MSDDIVDRLRSYADTGVDLGDNDLHELAADEIERLRAANEDLDAACSLRLIEIERLRDVIRGLMAGDWDDDE